ncbi:hypothetical protein BDV95DRAFT_637490 [Massariosphaeria phaeospora]|uniref:Uncharacterized protein n=1 Tax=Massariosphaeria phaeospora TaxID=100035 RepID=A0A7C8I536_9PLEO|nr:hypothetical protein BDV95DRAFT_637490 [Massariosphaeria phaeospora]
MSDIVQVPRKSYSSVQQALSDSTSSRHKRKSILGKNRNLHFNVKRRKEITKCSPDQGERRLVIGDMNSEDARAYRGGSYYHTTILLHHLPDRCLALPAGFDTVISALNRNVLLAQIPLLQLAEASPTIHIFSPSEYRTDIKYNPSSATGKPHQLKLQVRKYIREHVQNLQITYLVPGPCFDLYIRNFKIRPFAGSYDFQLTRRCCREQAKSPCRSLP